jgi:hypothetical protein
MWNNRRHIPRSFERQAAGSGSSNAHIGRVFCALRARITRNLAAPRLSLLLALDAGARAFAQ